MKPQLKSIQSPFELISLTYEQMCIDLQLQTMMLQGIYSSDKKVATLCDRLVHIEKELIIFYN